MKNNKPIRCFEGSANPHDPFWNFRNAAETESGETEIEFYGPISEFSWWGDEVTPKMFKDQLYAQGKNGPVTVRLNSPGGDLIAASVIRATMLDYPGRVTVKIDGLAASAAVMVALGGDAIKMQISAYMMIHEAAVGIMGYFNIDDMKELIDELKVINAGIVDAYASKTKMDSEKLQKMMNEETWMTASEAVAYGFVDEIITAGEKKSAEGKQQKLSNYANALKHYVNVPKALLQTQPEEAAPVIDERQVQRLRDEVKILI
jgi:ATP-dependent Clp protease, protease subunit